MPLPSFQSRQSQKILSFALVAALTGCGSDSDDTPVVSSSAAQTSSDASQAMSSSTQAESSSSAAPASSSEEASSSATISSSEAASTSSSAANSSSEAASSSDASAECATVEGNLVNNGGVESGLTPWSQQGDAMVAAADSEAHCGANSLLVTGRTASWHAAVINLPNLVASTSYDIEVWVKMAPGQSIETINLTVNYTDDSGSANYSGVTGASVGPDDWVKLSGTYNHLPTGTSSGVYAYLESPSETASYYIDDFSIVGEAANNEISYPELDPNANGGLAAGNAKFLGNIIASTIPSSYGTYWNQVTPENSGKWGVTEPAQDFYSWGTLDRAYAYAKVNGMPFKGHTLVWGSQEPSWIGDLTPAEQLAEVEEWIQDYCARYDAPSDGGFVHLLDVVNEPTNAPASYREALGGAGSTGWDWIIWTYEKAREHCPEATLLINDYNIINYAINSDSAANANAYEEIITLLNNRDLLDGIAFQTHAFSINGLNPWDDISAAQIDQALDRFASFGLPLYIAELDIDDEGVNQCERYKELFPAMWEHPSMAGVTLWGYIEGQTWRNTQRSGIVRADGTEKAAMLWLREYFGGNGTAACGADE